MQGENPVKNDEEGVGKNSLLMEAVELEIDKEKKKIREEIIAEEIIRRRKLEAEVRMELMMEEQIMGMRGLYRDYNYVDPYMLMNYSSGFSGFRGRSSYLQHNLNNVGNSVDEIGKKINLVNGIVDDDDLLKNKSNLLNDDHVGLGKWPFERDSSLVGSKFAGKSMAKFGGIEQQVLGQVMPSSGISGMKRKAETSVVASDEETASVASKDLQKKKWYCSLCGVSATSAGGLNLHLHGKKHKAKESVSKSGDTVSISSTENNSVENSMQPMELAAESLVQSKEEVKNNVLPLEEEKSQVQTMEEGQSQVQPMEEEKSQVTKKWECSLCQIFATSEILLHSHLQGKKHKAKEAKLGISQGIHAEPAKKKNEDVKKWYCSICQVSAVSEKNLNDHLQGKKHKAKAGLTHQEADNVDSDSVVREESLEKEEGIKNEQEKVDPSTKHGKSQSSDQDIVNTLNTVKIGLDRDEAETEELKSSSRSQEMNGKPVKLWHCKMCNEGTYDEATMVSHRKSSKHMKLLRRLVAVL